MSESGVCPKCGLPKDLCICETMAREEEKIRVSLTDKRYKKIVTVIEGISGDVDIKNVLRDLKTKLACGGTYKNKTVELQGNHIKRIKDLLVKMGFPAEKIEIAE
ncbi:MAG: stress response translation initiation inhibitor YciH [Candidatus Aenigmatarchaeota archaeon]|nr:MAG: stress response translation initiation inhibitor YciH [Candidatus Aenigmarchaeota archaeon]